MPKKLKIVQFKLVLGEGGGEKVMRAIRKLLNAEIYTFDNQSRDTKVHEIGTATEDKLAGLVTKI